MDSLQKCSFDILRRFEFASVLAFLCITLATSPGPSAQCSPPCPPECLQVEGGPFFEAWVDPSTGCDPDPVTCPEADKISGPGLVSITVAKAHPFKTIGEAIAFVNAAVMQHAMTPPNPSPSLHPGIVHLEPGIYTQETQTFPVRMR